eukprot:RCo007276
MIPTPTLASWIIETSFAPSPTDTAVTPRRWNRATTRAFCMGVTRQQIALETRSPRSWNFCSCSWPKTSSSAAPSITMVDFCPGGSLETVCMAASIWVPMSSPGRGAVMWTRVSALMFRRRELAAMLTAVSRLSPVSIQITTPAARKKAIVSGTLSCRRSSTPEHPTRARSCSSRAQASATAASRPSRRSAASSKVAFQDANSPSSKIRYPTTRVRSPCLAIMSSCRTMCRCHFASSLPLCRSRGIIVASAPLESISSCPEGSRTTTDIRLRSELNSHTARISNRCGWPCTSTVMYMEVRSLRT